MKQGLTILLLLLFLRPAAQVSDSAEVLTLSKETVLSEVVIRNDLNVARFLRRVKEDTSFYKAFRTLHILSFTSLNDIRMVNRSGTPTATLLSRTRQER